MTSRWFPILPPPSCSAVVHPHITYIHTYVPFHESIVYCHITSRRTSSPRILHTAVYTFFFSLSPPPFWIDYMLRTAANNSFRVTAFLTTRLRKIASQCFSGRMRETNDHPNDFIERKFDSPHYFSSPLRSDAPPWRSLDQARAIISSLSVYPMVCFIVLLDWADDIYYINPCMRSTIMFLESTNVPLSQVLHVDVPPESSAVGSQHAGSIELLLL